MNKAFTKEEDLEYQDIESPQPLPAGKSYLTPAGAERMRNELRDLRLKQRPELTKVIGWAAANGDRSENGDYTYNKKKLREVDRRIRFLSKRLESAEVVDPLLVKTDEVRFGATVTIRNEDDQLKTYSIVGVDEVELQRGRISFASPLGAALMKAKVGDLVPFRSPRGVQEIEVVEIQYIELP